MFFQVRGLEHNETTQSQKCSQGLAVHPNEADAADIAADILSWSYGLKQGLGGLYLEVLPKFLRLFCGTILQLQLLSGCSHILPKPYGLNPGLAFRAYSTGYANRQAKPIPPNAKTTNEKFCDRRETLNIEPRTPEARPPKHENLQNPMNPLSKGFRV